MTRLTVSGIQEGGPFVENDKGGCEYSGKVQQSGRLAPTSYDRNKLLTCANDHN
jgi:hypothetical protein